MKKALRPTFGSIKALEWGVFDSFSFIKVAFSKRLFVFAEFL